MRKTVNIKIPVSDLDYGKKPYGSNTAYQGQARKASSKMEHDSIVRQYSEFKRPQGNHESYQEMEHWADPPPGFVFPDFTLPDWFDYPVPDFDWGEGGLRFLCACFKDECYCPGETRCFSAGCTYPVRGVQVMGGSGKFSASFGGHDRICITASEDAVFSVDLNITLLKLKPDGKGGVTKHGTCVVGKIYSKCDDDECETCDDTGMAWDSGTSAETVARSASCTVAITDSLGTGGPYTWSVSGTGFTLDNAETVGLTNTLRADGDACGLATITVTGCDATVVKGYVRGTVGTWAEKNYCHPSTSGGACQTDVISSNGKDRAIENWCTQGSPDRSCGDQVTNDCFAWGIARGDCDGSNVPNPATDCLTSSYQPCWCTEKWDYEWECS